MALILRSGYVSPWLGGNAPTPVKENASDYYLSIPGTYLSKPYDLRSGDVIKGTTLKVEGLDGKEIEALRNNRIGFILYRLMGLDYLFMSKDDWETRFREYGLVTGFAISMKFEEVERDNETVASLYTKKDLEL